MRRGMALVNYENSRATRSESFAFPARIHRERNRRQLASPRDCNAARPNILSKRRGLLKEEVAQREKEREIKARGRQSFSRRGWA